MDKPFSKLPTTKARTARVSRGLWCKSGTFSTLKLDSQISFCIERNEDGLTALVQAC